ncbi:MAG: ribonuclease D [Symplocastrum torsivum CPER-KK1]|jgi:ribonuclease D|uniref:Ribonuclease D n=1 Tax=Symplocastrum torsivum CPER-KK1 TaxID=450513 RepID=A0A951PMH4_9CYAN|nr:ribonuclease D [Symplocastrum torsivum CPER-KK1]
MPYLTNSKDIQNLMARYAQSPILWIDTEVADHQTRKPKVSLIQVLDDPTDLTGEHVSILDVLNHPELIEYFVDKIIVNPAVEKVFHNASYDLKLLGKTKAQNVTCTLELAKKIPYYLLQVRNLQLKTLAEELCYFPPVDKTEQTSDWGVRPLTASQLHYAKMDAIYVAHVHQQLLKLNRRTEPDPATEDLTALSDRYQQIAYQWKLLDTEMTHLQERLKKAMQAQNVSETGVFELSSYHRTSKKVQFDQLAKLAQAKGIELDFPVALTQKLQKELGDMIEQLQVEEEVTTNWRLSAKDQNDEELPF